MKMSSLFDLIADSRDVLTFFEGVENKEQLVSRLERLKRADLEEILDSIESLRLSVTQILGDTLEMNSSGPDDEDDDDNDELNLGDFGEEIEESEGIPVTDPENQPKQE